MASSGRLVRLRDFGRRQAAALTAVGTLGTIAALVFVLAGQQDEFTFALSRVSLGTLAVVVVLQIVALLTRSEAWHLSIEAAGGSVGRRVLSRQVGQVGSLVASGVARPLRRSVAVACAATKSISSGCKFERLSARFIASAAPRPPGAEAVMW